MNEWHDLFVATTGASAALAGLVFVGVSINLANILAIPKLPDRALVALVLLLTVLVISIEFLIPAQPLFVTGIEILITCITAWIFITKLDTGIYRNTGQKFKSLYLIEVIINQISLLPFFISGIIMLNGIESGTYWIVPGILLCMVKGFVDAWVLLVEINR